MQLDAGCRHPSVASVQPRQHVYTGSQTQLLVWSQTTSISVRTIQFFIFLKFLSEEKSQRASSVPSTPIWDLKKKIFLNYTTEISFSEFIQENQWKKNL